MGQENSWIIVPSGVANIMTASNVMAVDELRGLLVSVAMGADVKRKFVILMPLSIIRLTMSNVIIAAGADK